MMATARRGLPLGHGCGKAGTHSKEYDQAVAVRLSTYITQRALNRLLPFSHHLIIPHHDYLP